MKYSKFYQETDSKYYWIGFLFADGGVINKYKSLISLYK